MPKANSQQRLRRARVEQPALPPSPPAAAPPRRPALRPALQPIAAAVLLAAAALALYWKSLQYPLIFDDAQLTEEYLRAYGASWFKLDLRWFAYASLGWTYDLAGMQWPWFRLGNIALHAAAATALFLLLARLLGAVLKENRRGLDPAWLAFFGALAFLLHPVTVYGTAYLIQRSIVMATLFSLVSLCLFLEGLLRLSRRWHVAAAAVFFAAVFSKEHCVMLPAVAAALAVLVRGPSLRLARELALPGVLFATIALLAVLKAKGVLGAQYEPFAQAAVARMSESQPAQALAPAASPDLYWLSVVNQGALFFRYLLAWLAPYTGWMSIDMRPAFPAHFPAWPWFAGLLAWAAWPVAAVLLLLRRSLAGLAGFAMLFPWLLALTEFAAVRIQEPFVLYRSYLWMSGFAALLPAVLCRVPPKWAAGMLGAACLALVPAALDRLETFSSSEAVWDDAVRKIADERAPLVDRAYRNRGVALYHAERYEAALRDFDKALALNPRSAEAWMTRGTLYMRAGRTGEALVEFDRAIELAPDYMEAYARRCVVLMRLQRYQDAFADCSRALLLDPAYALNHTSLGMLEALRNRPAEAEAAYRRALELAPSSADTQYQYGVLLAGTGRRDEAARRFAAACAAGIEAACRRR